MLSILFPLPHRGDVDCVDWDAYGQYTIHNEPALFSITHSQTAMLQFADSMHSEHVSNSLLSDVKPHRYAPEHLDIVGSPPSNAIIESIAVWCAAVVGSAGSVSEWFYGESAPDHKLLVETALSPSFSGRRPHLSDLLPVLLCRGFRLSSSPSM